MNSRSPSVDVDCFVFASREANWLGSSIEAVSRAAKFAEQFNLSVRTTLVLRDMHQPTRDWVSENMKVSWRVADLSVSSASEARNEAVRLADGQCIAFIDGSDMVGESWLRDSCHAACKLPGVYRPEALITFGPDSFLSRGFEFTLQKGTECGELFMGSSNPLPSGFTTNLSILKSSPWPCEDAERGWSDVDWWWNALVVASGHPHRIINGSAHYRRMSVRALRADENRVRTGPVIRPRATV